MFGLPLIWRGTLFKSNENVPDKGGEWVLARVTVKLLATVPCTKAVLLVVGRGVVGRYLFKIMLY